ncbi:MAG: ATP-dependent Clp protease adaptor ClpS [Melioribacteraceae bacterium]|nr:ATP-dependent Clp protease adaptor ClpS [Melioribacteraceae bacterium]MCF8265865.1 ATP-dependent Clp protease adaptor ClpS [Melioribacteraceae bacterium]MCF8412449.1 ATP-dependent Clp protease adaptor ClpS [Melioribacteraceae bacterium]MCF8432726.1 ATP-dependent Clp protease adaptor ClpS [Melioribacteraceae bacterium]
MANEHNPGILEPEIDERTDIDVPFRVILFNDDWHTFDEVINQIIKATNCSFEVARTMTFEIHFRGKAVVFFGGLQKCLKVTSVLEEIALHTQIESD